MKQYIYYNRLDFKKEPLSKIKANDLGEAILIAAGVKQISIEDFLNVFKVEKYEQRKIQKSK